MFDKQKPQNPVLDNYFGASLVWYSFRTFVCLAICLTIVSTLCFLHFSSDVCQTCPPRKDDVMMLHEPLLNIKGNDQGY